MENNDGSESLGYDSEESYCYTDEELKEGSSLSHSEETTLNCVWWSMWTREVVGGKNA